MKVVVNKIIPFKGFKAVNLFGILFTRSTRPVSKVLLNHESIHTLQMKELAYVGFYVWYGVEFLIRLVCLLDWHSAYRNVCFEREAYNNELNSFYLKQRKSYSFIKYI